MIRQALTSESSRSRTPNGYALIGVLWICAAATALALSAAAASRHVIAASRNRIALARAEWAASGCLARARSVLSEAIGMEGTAASYRQPAWSRVDEILGESSAGDLADCVITARAVGSRLNVNSADEATLSRLLRGAGLAPAQADSLAAAIADWKDADDTPRPLGAEREWYEAVGKMPPANRPFAHVSELALVRNAAGALSLDDLLDVEEGVISINHAPAPVLGILPGFTREAVEHVLNARTAGRPITAFAEIRNGLSAAAAESLAEAEPQLVAHASLVPQAWVLTVRSVSGAPAVTVVLEVRIERFATEIVIVRRRSWVL
jgi:general secretion pathway protein K